MNLIVGHIQRNRIDLNARIEGPLFGGSQDTHRLGATNCDEGAACICRNAEISDRAFQISGDHGDWSKRATVARGRDVNCGPVIRGKS